MSTDRERLVEDLYSLLDELRDRTGGFRYLDHMASRLPWPHRGVYFFFDHDEPRSRGSGPRVVRVGTHALRRGSRSSLWGRLGQHRGFVHGSMPGGGNHRGSIFRLHVGVSLLARGAYPDVVRETWGRGSSAPREVREAEYALERDVSAYISALPLLWVDIDDDPGPGSDRGVIERGVIAALSGGGSHPADRASPDWLGRHSDRSAIRESGLWNVNHVGEPVDLTFLDALARRVRQG